MNMIRRSFQPILLMAFLAAFVASGLQVKEGRKQLSAQYALNIISAPPSVVRLIAGEFNGLMADFTLLQIGSFTGSGRKDIAPAEWRNVILGYDQIMEMDPHFEQTYLQAQSDVAWDARLPGEAIRLLDISKNSRPWDFRPGYFMGFDFYYFLGDYDRASAMFLETAKVKDAPVLLVLLGSRFATLQGRTQASLLVLENMLNEPDIAEDNAKEIRNRITALHGVMAIENAVKAFSEKFGSNPESLDRLVETGILEALPPNPYATSYTYDANTHEVRFDGVRALKQ